MIDAKQPTNLLGVVYTPRTSSLVIPARNLGQSGIEVALVNRDGSAVITAADMVADARLRQFADLLSTPVEDGADLVRSFGVELDHRNTFAARYGMTVEEALKW